MIKLLTTQKSNIILENYNKLIESIYDTTNHKKKRSPKNSITLFFL